MRLQCSLCVYVSPAINFWLSGPSLRNLVCVSLHLRPSQRLLHKSSSSLCLYMYPPIVGRQRIGRHVPVATNTRNSERNFAGVVFYTIRVVWKRVCGSACIPVSLLGGGSLITFSYQRKIIGGVAFYAGDVVSKESRRLVLTRLLMWKWFESWWVCLYYRSNGYFLLIFTFKCYNEKDFVLFYFILFPCFLLKNMKIVIGWALSYLLHETVPVPKIGNYFIALHVY
jgi:hypothetical protein